MCRAPAIKLCSHEERYYILLQYKVNLMISFTFLKQQSSRYSKGKYLKNIGEVAAKNNNKREI